jgi:hypothetical protein
MNPAIYLMLLVSRLNDTIEAEPIALYAQLVSMAPQLSPRKPPRNARDSPQERQRQPQAAPKPGSSAQNGRGPFSGRVRNTYKWRGDRTTCEPRREPGAAG